MARFKLNPGDPPKMTDEQLRRLREMSDAEITAAAEADPDNPPLTGGELQTLASADFVRAVRRVTGMNQADFAEAFGFSIGRLRDLEQGRTQIDGAMRCYLTVISKDPTFVLANLDRLPDGYVGSRTPKAAVIGRGGVGRIFVTHAADHAGDWVVLSHSGSFQVADAIDVQDGKVCLWEAKQDLVSSVVREIIGGELHQGVSSLRGEIVQVVRDAMGEAKPKARNAGRLRERH